MNKNNRITIKKATKNEINSILLIQEHSLFEKKEISNKRENGFLRTRMEYNTIKVFIENGCILIALNNEEVIGYAIAGKWSYFLQWDIFKIMLQKLHGMEYQGIKINEISTYHYGPICIEPSSQGMGIFPLLFLSINSIFLKEFKLGLTFIDKSNYRSLLAHTKKFDMRIIESFNYNNQEYYTLPISKENIIRENLAD